MIGHLPIISFDTSAHNRLLRDSSRSEAVLAGIKSGLFFRFAGLSIEELVATPDPTIRAALFTYCARLQHGPSDCLYPQNELIRLLIVDHFRNASAFNWTTVDVRGREYEDAIRSRAFVSDQQLTTAQGQDLKGRKTGYKQTFSKPRLHIQEIFEKHQEAPPATLREAISRLQSADAALIWTIGKWVYDRGAETDASKDTITQFIEVCPPFRALIYAMLMSWYNFSVRDPNVGERFNAGGNDQFMSIYLSYCDKFVTADDEQEKSLREIAFLASLETRTYLINASSAIGSRGITSELPSIGSNRTRHVSWFSWILVSLLPLSCPKSEPYRQADGVARSAVNSKLRGSAGCHAGFQVVLSLPEALVIEIVDSKIEIQAMTDSL